MFEAEVRLYGSKRPTNDLLLRMDDKVSKLVSAEFIRQFRPKTDREIQ